MPFKYNPLSGELDYFESGGISAHELLDGGTAHLNTVAQGVSVGSLIYGNATPKWDELVHPGVANRALRSTSTLPTWAQGDIDFGTYKAIAMACDNGPTLPTSPTPVAGQWFLHTPTGREILMQYSVSAGAWSPIFSLNVITMYVRSDGVDTQNSGYANAAGQAFLTLAYAAAQVPPNSIGYVIITVGPGSFAGANFANKVAPGFYVQGVFAPVNSKNIRTITGGDTLGSATVQPVITLTTAVPAQAIPGGIVAFTSGANNNQHRVINSVSGNTLTLCGSALSAIAAADADTLSFLPFTTIITSTIRVESSVPTFGAYQLKFQTADYGLLSSGNDVVCYECHVVGVLEGLIVQNNGILTITNSGLIQTGGTTLVLANNMSMVIVNGSLLRFASGTPGNGFRLLFNSAGFSFNGTVYDGLRSGVNGLPGSMTFQAITSNNFVKNCTAVGVNEELQLTTSGLLSSVTFGTVAGGNANTVDFLPYKFEVGVSVNRRAVADAITSAVVSDQVIAYTSLTATRVVSLMAAAQAGAGKVLIVKDESGSASPTVKITLAGVARTISTTKNGTTTLTSAALFGLVNIGDVVTGTGIPASTKVTAKASSSSLTISNAATDSLTSSLVFTESIDGSASKDITTAYGMYQIYSIASAWFTIGKF